jgi:hypothetical protein
MKLIGILVKLLILAALAIGVWFGYQHFQEQRKLIEAQNDAIGLMNDGKYPEVVESLRKLLDELRSSEMQTLARKNVERVKSLLAQSLVAWADGDYAASLATNIERYREAYELDPDSVDNPLILKCLESSIPQSE